jgi:RNA polymerase sigma-70 factor (sigma-E family)
VFTDVYVAHYPSLLRLAALLVDGTAACEDVVQESYVRVFARRTRLRDETMALAYLRQAVVNLSRTSLRRTVMARSKREAPPPNASGPDEQALDRIEQDTVVRALRRLPRRQREVLALRYYADLSEADVADTLGLSVGSVKSYASRGLDRLALEMAELS